MNGKEGKRNLCTKPSQTARTQVIFSLYFIVNYSHKRVPLLPFPLEITTKSTADCHCMSNGDWEVLIYKVEDFKRVNSKLYLSDDFGVLHTGIKNLIFMILKITIAKSKIINVFIFFSKGNIS